MVNQTQTFPSVFEKELEQGKCCMCGRPATTEIGELQREFCQAHLAECRQIIDDWVNRGISYHRSYKSYGEQNPALKQNNSHFDNQSNIKKEGLNEQG